MTLQKRYEKASGNTVNLGNIFDDSGNFVDFYTEELAEAYLELVEENKDEE